MSSCYAITSNVLVNVPSGSLCPKLPPFSHFAWLNRGSTLSALIVTCSHHFWSKLLCPFCFCAATSHDSPCCSQSATSFSLLLDCDLPERSLGQWISTVPGKHVLITKWTEGLGIGRKLRTCKSQRLQCILRTQELNKGKSVPSSATERSGKITGERRINYKWRPWKPMETVSVKHSIFREMKE